MDTRPNEFEQPAQQEPTRSEPIIIGPVAAPEPVPAPDPAPAVPVGATTAPVPYEQTAAPVTGPAASVFPTKVVPQVAPTPQPAPLPVATPIPVAPQAAQAPMAAQPGSAPAPRAERPVPAATLAVTPAPIAPPAGPSTPAGSGGGAGYGAGTTAPTRVKKPASKPKVWALVLVAAVVSAVVGAAVAVGITLLVAANSNGGFIGSSPVSSSTNGGSSIVVKGESANLSETVAKKGLPSVVSITVSAAVQSNPFTNSTTETEQDSGSGVIIKPDGYIITNNHVISGGNKIVVNAGGKNYTAKVVGADTGTDIAVLKIDASDLPAIAIGTSNDLEVGQYVMAIGCPFGLEKSVSTGIISGLGRSDLMATDTYVTAYTDLIQTDAAINPGNSGGALVDQNAHLIGINALINSTSGSSAGVGFAIPIDTAIDIANQIMTTGKVVHPFLGVSTQTVTSDVAQAYKMPVQEGAYVVNVSSGSPAASAGLKADDIITQIDSKKVTSSDDVFTAVRSHKVGDSITITYYRGTKKMTAKATLASDAANQQQQQQQEQQLQQQQEQGTNGSLDGSGSSGSSGSSGNSSTNPHSGYTPQELQDLLDQYGLGNGNSGNSGNSN